MSPARMAWSYPRLISLLSSAASLFPGEGEGEFALVVEPDGDLVGHGTGGHLLEDFARDLRQERPADDVVHVARARLHFRAAFGNRVDHLRIDLHGHPVVFLEPLLKLPQLEPRDLLE